MAPQASVADNLSMVTNLNGFPDLTENGYAVYTYPDHLWKQPGVVEFLELGAAVALALKLEEKK